MSQDDSLLKDPKFAEILLETMADGVFTLNEKGKITSWNPAMQRISGYTAEEALGNSCSLLTFDSCISQVCPSGITQCGIFEYGQVDGKKCALKNKSGEKIAVVKSARLIRDEAGEVRGVVETMTDLSELYKTQHEVEKVTRQLQEIHNLDNIIGKSHSMTQIFSAITAAANSEATVLLLGESGTGKELVANGIHFQSNRASKPLVTVNCSALTETLLESELFGHAKGAFTGAHRDRIGRFEEADGGTIFLDEIGELSPYIQVKLLRVLQEREIERVGESKKRKVDIRIITATNKDLYKLIQEGSFREDLFYRLKVFPIRVPTLRERKEDIPLLTRHFIASQNEKTGKKIKGIVQAGMRMLMDYNWPGNVRELENAVEHGFVLCNEEWIDVFDLPVELRRHDYQARVPFSHAPSPHEPEKRPQKLTREGLMRCLEESDWNKAEVGRRVGLSRTAIWKYMKKWDIPLKKADN